MTYQEKLTAEADLYQTCGLDGNMSEEEFDRKFQAIQKAWIDGGRKPLVLLRNQPRFFKDYTIPEKLKALETQYKKGVITPWEFFIHSMKARGEISEEECTDACKSIDDYIEENFIFKS